MKALILFFLLAPPSYEQTVAVEAAYAIVTHKDESPAKCCGDKPKCVGGKIVHGDGHVTDCPCPDTCACKKYKALLHPPTVIR